MQATLSDARTWRDAVCIAIDEMTRNDECFTSGHIVDRIRKTRKDLFFRQSDVGEYVRDLFFSNSMIFDVDGAKVHAYQVPRYTEGRSRTPYGHEVFVYASSPAKGNDFNFELEIAKAGARDASNYLYQPYGTLSNETVEDFDDDDIVATVHSDGRLCVPRRAFNALMHESKTTIQSGDPVHILFDEDEEKIIISLDPCNGAKTYYLTRDRGRVKYKPEIDVDWYSGDSYPVDISNSQIVIDLSDPRQ